MANSARGGNLAQLLYGPRSTLGSAIQPDILLIGFALWDIQIGKCNVAICVSTTLATKNFTRIAPLLHPLETARFFGKLKRNPVLIVVSNIRFM